MMTNKKEIVVKYLFYGITFVLFLVLLYFINRTCSLIGHAWDDYSYSWMGKTKGAINTALDQYHWWNGRLFPNFSLAFVYRYVKIENQQNYAWIAYLCAFISLPFVILKKSGFAYAEKLTASIILGMAWLLTFPSICKGIAWNTGSFNYLLPFLLAMVACYMLFSMKKWTAFIFLIPLYIFLISAEVVPFLFFVFFAALLFHPERTVKFKAALSILVTLLSFVTILSSPGYANHQAAYGYNNTHNLHFSLIQTAFSSIHLLMEPTLLFPIINGLFLALILGKRKMLKREHWIPFISYITFAVITFSVFWNQSLAPPPRISNTVFSALYIPLSYYAWGCFSCFSKIDRLNDFNRALIYPIFFLIFCLLASWPTRFYGQRLLEVFYTGGGKIMPEYYQYRVTMLNFLKDHPNSKITYPKFRLAAPEVPNGLHHSQNGEEEKWIRYSLMRNYQLLELKWGGDVPKVER